MWVQRSKILFQGDRFSVAAYRKTTNVPLLGLLLMIIIDELLLLLIYNSLL